MSLETLLGLLLVLVLPALQMGRSLRPETSPKTRLSRYWQTIAIATGLMAMLAVVWSASGRDLETLGFDSPISKAGLIGLGLAFCLLIALAAATLVRTPKTSDADGAALAMLPATTAELCVFVAFSCIVGLAWETLYRGYLMWWLEPRLGTAFAVVVAAMAYGLGHGVKNMRQTLGSLLAAFAFTIGFVLTRSLLWLILLHAGLPMISVLAMRVMRRAGIGELPPAVVGQME